MRNVELLNYTDYETIGKAREFYVRVKAENPEFMLAWHEFYECIKNTFILEAGETGIKRYEDMLGIEPEGSLEDRRLKVYMLWNASIVWTDRTLRQYLDLLLGKGAYELKFIYDKYAINIKLYHAKARIRTTTLIDELRKFIPPNIQTLTTIEIDNKLYFAGVRRRALYMKYKQYEPTLIKGNLYPRVAGYLVNTIIKSWPINNHGNLTVKGFAGYLTSDKGKIRGEVIE